MRRVRTLLLVLAVSTAGCYQYVPVETTPPQGTSVRAGLSSSMSFELSEITANRIVEIRGEVVTASAERLVLSAFSLVSQSDFEHLAAGETIVVPQDAVAWIEKREISASRTALVGAALVGVGFLIEAAIRGGGGGEDDGGGPPIK